MKPRFTIVPGGRSHALPPDVQDDMPRQLILEYPAILALAYDAHTGQVTQARVEAMPDRVNVYDRDTWHELPSDDEAVTKFLSIFNPRQPLAEIDHLPVQWLEKDTLTS